MRGWAGVAYLTLLLGACAHTDTVIETRTIGGTPVMLTTADVRLVAERPNLLIPGGTIFCAEPSPDVAKALSTAFQATGAGKGAAAAGEGAISVDAALAFATAEQLAQLTERIPTIQALRDGLYRACEATANGLIGQAAYALILSRYGDLLVTMVLGEAAAGSYGRELAKLTAPNAVTNLPTPQSGDAGSKTNLAAGALAGNPAPADGATSPLADGALTVAATGLRGAAATPPPPAGPSQQTPPTAAKDFLLQFQQNYLSHSSVGPLLVSCINTVEMYSRGLLTVPPTDPIVLRCREFVTSLGQFEIDQLRQRTEQLRLENERTRRQLAAQARSGRGR
jgi:hypothetical protein